MMWLASIAVLITAGIVFIVASGRYVGTALFKLEIGERYEVKACVERESSGEPKPSSFWLMLLEDHQGTVKYYKITKKELPEISLGDAIILMTDGKIHKL